MGDSPILTLVQKVDIHSLRMLQVFLCVITLVMVVFCIMAGISYGWNDMYVLIGMTGTLIFGLFVALFPRLIRKKLRGMVFKVFDNRIERHCGQDILAVLPFSEVLAAYEERTPSQKELGLTTIVLEIYPDSYFKIEGGVSFYYLRDIPAANNPATTITRLLDAYHAAREIKPPSN